MLKSNRIHSSFVVLGALTLASSSALADAPGVKLGGSLHAKTELFTADSEGSTGFGGIGGGSPVNETTTHFEGFLNGDLQAGTQTSIHFSLPVQGTPYPTLQDDMTQAFMNWTNSSKTWEIDLGRFGTPFSLESNEVAKTHFANHGLLWGQVTNGLYPALVPPRGHTGVRFSTHWGSIKTEFIYALPEAFVEGSSSVEAGARTEWASSETSKWTFGVLHSVAAARESRQLLHAGGAWKLGSADLSSELLFCSEKMNGLGRTQSHGMAIRGAVPLSDTWSSALRVEYVNSDSNPGLLTSLAMSQKVTPEFDIRYQIRTDHNLSETAPFSIYELGISGSINF